MHLENTEDIYKYTPKPQQGHWVLPITPTDGTAPQCAHSLLLLVLVGT